MQENCSFNKYTDSGAGLCTQEPRVLLIEKPTTVCLYISEQMVIDDYFLLCHREFSSVHQKLLFH